MSGGSGDDIYYVNSNSDTVNEGASSGTDLIYSSATNFAASNNVENLTLTGSSNINGTGNTLPNTITGNSGNNTLVGGNASDTLIGNAGNDYLNGGNGNDTMIGGSGNDTLHGGNGNDNMSGGSGDDIYYVNSNSDTVNEGASSGTDLIYSSATNFTASNNVENLTLTGSSNINGTGNTLANTITGNSGNNTLIGDNGNDILMGNAGNDILFGGTGNDQITGGSGNDTFRISTGSGRDLITDYLFGQDNIELPDGISSSDLSLSLSGSDSIIRYSSDLLAIIEDVALAELTFI
ncbi:Alkaline phosphatasee [Prochlorococcus marinus str. GP2]|uniref:Alkaline phosphatasee n=4 Tax=Prochlorococcus marinus TaxID=1219 RepID=A0A0A1Z719_PROMR|nr:Alkaline phosphatasee [Prochlorococcus marinus str. GP2]